jgi:hypothetical protein
MTARFTSDRFGNIYPVSEIENLKQIKQSNPKYHLHTRGEVYKELIAERFERANGRAPTADELQDYIYSVAKWENDLFAAVES